MGKQISEYIRKIYPALLILFVFFLPISTSLITILAVLMIILWLVEGDFANKFAAIKSNPLSYAIIAYLGIHVLGLLWTHDLRWGIKVVMQQWKILFFFVLLGLVRESHKRYYIGGFIAGMAFCVLISFLVWFGVVPQFGHASLADPTPFMTRIIYNPFLAFSIYLLLYFLLFEPDKQKFHIGIALSLLVAMVINMFITGGRTGQVGLFVLLALVVFQYYKQNIIMSGLAVVLLLPLCGVSAYYLSPNFHERVDQVIIGVKEHQTNRNTSMPLNPSIPLRLTFLANSWAIAKDHLLFGVGTGDFPEVYKQVNVKKSPDVDTTVNPHNMYLLVLVQTGLIGLMALFSFFVIQIRSALREGPYKEIKLALPVLFLSLMLGESYLLIHASTLLFIFFSAFLYNDGESVGGRQTG